MTTKTKNRADAAESTTASKGLLRVRVDDALREEAEAKLEQMGLTMSVVVNILCRRIAAEGKLPFEIYAVKTPGELTLEAMKEGRAIIASKKARFGNAEELFDDLEKEVRASQHP